jgi:hypothetical protein
MQVKLDRRYSNGLLWTTSYTLSRAKDYGTNENQGIGTPADLSRSYGLADYDRTHSLVSSFVYEVPFFKDAKGAAGAILGGWQIAGIFAAQSGTPIDIRGGSALRAPGNQQRPDLIGTQRVIGDIGPGQQYFDIAPYAASAPNTWGNMTRNAGPRGPGYVNLDASLVKRFKLNGRFAAELRADAFNATNTPHFDNPNRDFGNPRFGQVTGTVGSGEARGGGTGPRLVRFGARLTF